MVEYVSTYIPSVNGFVVMSAHDICKARFEIIWRRHVLSSPSAYFYGGSKVITPNNYSRAEESLGTRLLTLQ